MRYLIHFIYALLVVLGGFIPWQPAAGMMQEQEPDIPPQIWKVDFEGNEQFADFVLSRQIAAEAPGFLEKLQFWDRSGYELSETELKKDVVRLRNYYQRRGYSNVKVDYNVQEGNKAWKKNVTFEIQENIPIRIRNVDLQFKGDSSDIAAIKESRDFQRAQEQQSYQQENRYETVREPEVEGRFVDVLKNMGYPYADVNIVAQIDSTELSADVNINLDIGPKSYIDSINVTGAKTVSKDYILREAGLNQGELYELEKLQEAQRELFDHHLFRFATISIPEQEQDSTLNLLLRIRENEKRSIELQGGYGTEEKFRGLVSWTNRNVAHRGHRFTSQARASFIEQYVNFDYLFPYIFNTKSSFVISPFGQHLLQDNYELLRAGVTNSFIYRHSEDFTSSAAYEYTINRELSRRFDTSLPDTTLEYDLSSLHLSAFYGQGFGRQREGWVIQPAAELSGLLGLAAFQFQKLSADVRRFTRLSNTTMLATRVQAGGLFNAPADSLPQNIRFYLGGTNSVRGWYRQELGPKRAQIDSTGFREYIPLGGRAMIGFNVEIRQELNFIIDGFGIAAFLDGGQVWEAFRDMDRPIQFGTGGGLRYQSPIGPVRVDIGYKINPTEADLNRYRERNFGSAWDRIGIHFSIGQAF